MSMGIGINTQRPDEGVLRRKQMEIACGVWFTSTGNTMPKMLKFRDEEGMIRRIDHICVSDSCRKYYCGIPIQEYRCSAVYRDRKYLFRLYYYIEKGCWRLSWEE